MSMGEPVRVAIVIIVRNREVLIGRRLSSVHLGRYWEFPGGKCEPGEGPESCALREAREELGVEVELTEGWAPLEHDYSDRRVRLYPFLGRIRSGVPRPLNCIELRWVDREVLSSYLFPEANGPILELLNRGDREQRECPIDGTDRKT